MAQPYWLRKIEASLFGVAISAMESHRNDAIAALDAAVAAAQGSKSQVNVNAAIEHFVPAAFRPFVDAELQQIEAAELPKLSTGAPAFFDAVIASLKSAQAKLTA